MGLRLLELDQDSETHEAGGILMLATPSLEDKKLNFQTVTKSAASAASLDLQGSQQTRAQHADGGAIRGRAP